MATKTKAFYSFHFVPDCWRAGSNSQYLWIGNFQAAV